VKKAIRQLVSPHRLRAEARDQQGRKPCVGIPGSAAGMFKPKELREGRVRVYGCSPGCLVVSLVLSLFLTLVLNGCIRLF
jgi:hypothetical protein